MHLLMDERLTGVSDCAKGIAITISPNPCCLLQLDLSIKKIYSNLKPPAAQTADCLDQLGHDLWTTSVQASNSIIFRRRQTPQRI